MIILLCLLMGSFIGLGIIVAKDKQFSIGDRILGGLVSLAATIIALYLICI